MMFKKARRGDLRSPACTNGFRATTGRSCGMVLCLLLLLTACQAKEPTQRALDFRTDLLESGGCGFTADISADYGDRVYDFTVTCDYTAGEGARIEVLQPEEIAGIAAQVSPDGAKVIFDGVELDFGQLAEGNVSPMAASWLLGHCWTEAYTDSAGTDGDLYRITHLEGYNEEELTVDTWLDDAPTPVHAEIAYDGTRCLNIDISDFYLKT